MNPLGCTQSVFISGWCTLSTTSLSSFCLQLSSFSELRGSPGLNLLDQSAQEVFWRRASCQAEIWLVWQCPSTRSGLLGIVLPSKQASFVLRPLTLQEEDVKIVTSTFLGILTVPTGLHEELVDSPEHVGNCIRYVRLLPSS